MVARFSGDKFGVILTDLLSRDEATGFADRLAKRLAEPYTLDGRQVFTSAKIGIAYVNSKYPEAEDILRDADIAMNYAKDNNQNYVIFDQKMHIRAVTRLQLETDLRFAIERNEFELFYQPIIALDTASLTGFEALVRWNHPQRGLVPPNEFIPISESTGLIIPMTVQILHAACTQVVAWQKVAGSSNPLSVAVNLSGKHFAHPALVEQITTVIKETGISPQSLKLELTESAVMDNAEAAILMLKQIKETGVQISIDDFGKGYSSLSYLHRFPIDLLKVDRSFVSAMEENSENGEIVRTVIALAKALGLKVVAEGIESIHQFHQLRILGCEYGQGYLFSKPLPVKEIERLLHDGTRWQNILPNPAPAVHPKADVAHLRLAQ
jgi:EAL domain-containing protein (putative c-di-GMP-specific phosphodiesterase class I)